MSIVPYLRALIEHPKLELLFKMGFYMLASDLVYHDSPNYTLHCSRKRPHEILQVWPEHVQELLSKDCRRSELQEYQKYRERGIGSEERKRIFTWMERYHLRDDHEILSLTEQMTLHKLLRYADEQFALLQDYQTGAGRIRYESMSRILGEYHDYLRMCRDQNYDMKSCFVLYPRNLQEAHDRLSASIKAKLDAKNRRNFMAAYCRIISYLDFEMKGLTIVYPEKPEDIVAERNNLHHCVGGYVSRVADKECIILFLRHSAEPGKSFYTIEIRNQKVVQVWGMQNCDPTLEVKQFMVVWENKVLQRTTLLAAA